MSEIMFIAPYPELADIALEVCSQDREIVIKVARMDHAVKLALEAERNGYQVIISRGVTSWNIKKSGIELPVVDVLIGGYDILRAYYEAKKKGQRIGIVDVEEIIQGLPSFENIIGDELVKYTCENTLDEIKRGMKRLKEQNVEVVIGKIAMANEARKHGMESVIITSGPEAVSRAVYEAKRVNQVRKQEKKKAEQLKAILNFTYDGIIALDENGRITAFNRVSEQTSGWRADEAIGRFITEVIPKAHCQRLLDTGKPELGEILEVGNARVVANRVPIIVDNNVEGVVTTFQQIDRLQKLESKVRRELAERGLVAKYQFADILGESGVLKDAVALAQEFAQVDSTVLIYGQTGSGKEMFAHAIHNVSRRRNEPFVAINCAALPESLLESELFGYVEGAFTGARKQGKAGVFEMAHNGTLFLDEVGEMSPMLQARLLRVIEQGEVMRLGDNSILPVNVRIIAATHRDLKEMVSEKNFREDLFYRLNVLSLYVPPLKERGKDILIIAERFLEEFCQRQGKGKAFFTPAAEETLLRYNWSGNIRELRNAMERLAILITGGQVSKEDVARALNLSAQSLGHYERPGEENGHFADLVEEKKNLERDYILQVIDECNGNRSEAARLLGIGRTTLWRKLQEGTKE